MVQNDSYVVIGIADPGQGMGYSMLLYNVIAILEPAVLARFSLRDANA